MNKIILSVMFLASCLAAKPIIAASEPTPPTTPVTAQPTESTNKQADQTAQTDKIPPKPVETPAPQPIKQADKTSQTAKTAPKPAETAAPQPVKELDAQLTAIVETHNHPSTLDGQRTDGKKLVAGRLLPVVLTKTAIVTSNPNTIVRQAPALCQIHEKDGIPDVTNYCGYYAAFNANNLASDKLTRHMDRKALADDFYGMLNANKVAKVPEPYENIDENGVLRNLKILQSAQSPETKIVIVEKEGMLPFILAEPTNNRPQEIIDFIEKRSQKIVLIYGYGALQEDGLGGQQHWVTILAERNDPANNGITFTVYDSLLNNWLTSRYKNDHLKYIDELVRGTQDTSLLESF